MNVKHLALAIVSVLAAEAGASGPFGFSYGGRLADREDRAVTGPVTLAVNFYRVATGGSPVLAASIVVPSVPLEDGVFQLDLDRIEEEYASMLHRIPSSETVGLKDDFNGPICYTPDGNPLVGPAPGLRNMWLAEGFSFGITAAGGTGHYLAQVMADGEAEIDMASLDPRRFGGWRIATCSTCW